MLFLKILSISVILVGLGLTGMFINILFKKGGLFPVFSIGKNEEMKKKGISCVKSEEIICHKQSRSGGGCACEGSL